MWRQSVELEDDADVLEDLEDAGGKVEGLEEVHDEVEELEDDWETLGELESPDSSPVARLDTQKRVTRLPSRTPSFIMLTFACSVRLLTRTLGARLFGQTLHSLTLTPSRFLAS